MQGTDYYRFLASALPASELGQAAWRRFRRAAIRRVQGLTGDLARGPDLTRELGLKTLDEFARRMRGERAGRAPIEPNERAEARRLVSRTLPGHAMEVCQRADRVLGGELFLFGSWQDHSRGELAPGIAAIDWTRDPLHGGHAPDLPAEELDRDQVGTDARATWEAARCAHVLWLAQAATVAGLAGTEKSRGAKDPGIYARAAALHVRDFLATQPVGRGIHWTCPMEAGLRVLHLAPALLLLRDAPELDALFWAEAAQLLWQHGRFLDVELEDAQTVPGNHLLADLAGLATLGLLFPELPGALGWRERGVTAFARELVRQTSTQGLAFEASLPYHRFTTELGLCVQAFARRQGVTLGAPALGRLWKMCEVVEGATLPDGLLASIGDNDSTRAFTYCLRPALDAKAVSALKAALGGPGCAPSVEPESLWLGGLAGLRRNAQQAKARQGGDTLFRADGLCVLKEGARAATLWAGDNGQHGLGGHAHNDKLSCEIVLDGRRLVVDPGCPTYLADPAERDRYRSTGVHPTMQVDRLEQAPIPLARPFLLPDAAKAQVVRTSAREVWAEHRGYLRVRPAALHRREVVLAEGIEAVVVTDRLIGEGEHICEVQWPLASREVVMRRANRAERQLLERLEALPFGEGRVDIDRVFALGAPGLKEPVALLAIASEQAWEAEVSESTWSPGYGERVCGRTVRARFRAELPFVVTTLFVSLAEARESER